jgi:hypothetical protein
MAETEIHGGELHYGNQEIRFEGADQGQLILSAMDSAGKSGHKVVRIVDSDGNEWNLLFTPAIAISLKTVFRVEGLGVS